MGRKSQITDSLLYPWMPFGQGEFRKCNALLMPGKRGGAEYSGISGAQERFSAGSERIFSAQNHHAEKTGRQSQLPQSLALPGMAGCDVELDEFHFRFRSIVAECPHDILAGADHVQPAGGGWQERSLEGNGPKNDSGYNMKDHDLQLSG